MITMGRDRNLIKVVIVFTALIILTLGAFWVGHCWPCGKESEWFGNSKTMLLAILSMILAGTAFGILRAFRFKHITAAVIVYIIISMVLVDLLVPFLPQHPDSPIGDARGLLVVMAVLFVLFWAVFSVLRRSLQDSTYLDGILKMGHRTGSGQLPNREDRMNACPNCGSKAVGIFRKLWLSPYRTVGCSHCGAPVTVSFSIARYTILTLSFVGWMVAPSFLSRRLVNSVLLLWVILLLHYYVAFVSLVNPTSASDIKRRVQIWQIITLVIVVLTALGILLWFFLS
jgi:hypothetical protein